MVKLLKTLESWQYASGSNPSGSVDMWHATESVLDPKVKFYRAVVKNYIGSQADQFRYGYRRLESVHWIMFRNVKLQHG